MPYIIDGNNLIGSDPDIPLNDLDGRKRIIESVRRFQERKNNKVVLVFDGKPDHGSRLQLISSRFTVIYPRLGESADMEIKKILEGYTYFKDVVLVSSDRELKTFARDKGARTVNAIDFLFELKKSFRAADKEDDKKERINQKLSDSEVDQWLKIFDQKGGER